MSGPAAGPRRRVYLHIGLQKTGTTYLQKICWQNREELARQGLDLVPGSRLGMFELMLDVRRRVDPSLDRPAAFRALSRLPAQLAAAPGDRALISEEALAEAFIPRIRALVTACGDREVHLVVTLRDLGRQIPSAWQQMIQSGSSLPFEDYLARLRDREARNGSWANKDVIKLLTRWSQVVPPRRVHVVTVPPPGGDPELLLRRFCAVLGVDAEALDTRLDRHNQSLGRVEAEVLRRVNAQLSPAHRHRDVYGDVGKRFLAVRILGARPGRRILVPTADEPWVRSVSHDVADHLREGGYDVVGDPDDLLPVAAAFADPETGRATEEEVSAETTRALAAVIADRMDQLRARRAEELVEQQREQEDRAARTAAAAAASGPRWAVRTRAGAVARTVTGAVLRLRRGRGG